MLIIYFADSQRTTRSERRPNQGIQGCLRYFRWGRIGNCVYRRVGFSNEGPRTGHQREGSWCDDLWGRQRRLVIYDLDSRTLLLFSTLLLNRNAFYFWIIDYKFGHLSIGMISQTELWWDKISWERNGKYSNYTYSDIIVLSRSNIFHETKSKKA